jgi:GH24 family phage-related lysozyme (muramidase)
MTQAQWLAEVSSRIRASEGLRLYKYRDSVDIVTLGYGYALEGQRPPLFTDAQWAAIQAAPIAIDSKPENAVEACITQEHAIALFDAILPTYIAQARASLATGIFDLLDDARRFVIVDLTYNLGAGSDGWGGFRATHDLIARAVTQKQQGRMDNAHALFGEAADHLAASAWYGEVGVRAEHDVTMMRSSEWSPVAA